MITSQDKTIEEVADEMFSTLPLIHRSIRRKLIRSAIADMPKDISAPHFEILKLLQETGTLHVAEIGERLQIARPQMTHLIDKLVEMEFVERLTSPEDRRIFNISLKSKARKFMAEQEKHIRNATREALAGLPPEALRDLSASLRKLQEIFLLLK